MNKLVYHILSSTFGACFEIRVLMRQTANVFGVDMPEAAGHSASELLRCYAQFSADAAARALESGENLEALQQRLYRMAYQMGSNVCRWLRPCNKQDCQAIITLLYRNLDIAISEEAPGEFRVCTCYFSAFYTPEICSVISAIDQGIFAGIYGGGQLAFYERITEGHKACKANFK